MFGLFGGSRKHAVTSTNAYDETWIFVSHASADLRNVRKIRNYLEDKGASPLLFHLRGLTRSEQFWPIIEREIEARNFFLYCESEAAQQSEWVRREREAVAAAAQLKPKRIGHIKVDVDPIDLSTLDDFLIRTRVFLSSAYADSELVAPFRAKLNAEGFSIFKPPGAGNISETIEGGIKEAAQHGWVLVFLSPNSFRSEWVKAELRYASQLRARIVPIKLTRDPFPAELDSLLRSLQVIDATKNPRRAPDDVVRALLRR